MSRKKSYTKRTNYPKNWIKEFLGHQNNNNKEKQVAVYYFSGEARYPKVYDAVKKYTKIPEQDPGSEWTIDVKLDDSSQKAFDDSGCQLRQSKDKKGFYTFRRPTQKVIKDEIVVFNPPVVIDADGNPLTKETAIGNGSKVTVKVEIYGTRMGTGHTLEAVRVDELVPYGNSKVVTPDDVVPF
jgi:hypothetical protein